MPSPGEENTSRGYIIPIGGAEDKLNEQTILARFNNLCGGCDAKIAIIPTASQLEDTGEVYEKIFRGLGANKATTLGIKTRADAKAENHIELLNEATGIFITGGNQLRLSTILGGTPVAQLIRKLNAVGTHVAGTSAGAAIMAEHMIAGGNSGPTPKQGIVNLCPGLGLTNHFIIDQHFRQRDRLGRLMSAVAYNPFLMGLGIDEDTAAFIDPNGVLEVIGSGVVTLVDPSELEYSSMDSAGRGDVLNLVGMRIHTLGAGCHYTLADGKITFPNK